MAPLLYIYYIRNVGGEFRVFSTVPKGFNDFPQVLEGYDVIRTPIGSGIEDYAAHGNSTAVMRTSHRLERAEKIRDEVKRS